MVVVRRSNGRLKRSLLEAILTAHRAGFGPTRCARPRIDRRSASRSGYSLDAVLLRLKVKFARCTRADGDGRRP
jgi:hypothetical protein